MFKLMKAPSIAKKRFKLNDSARESSRPPEDPEHRKRSVSAKRKCEGNEPSARGPRGLI